MSGLRPVHPEFTGFLRTTKKTERGRLRSVFSCCCARCGWAVFAVGWNLYRLLRPGRKKAGRAKDAPWSQAFESSMLRKIELGRGLDVQLSEKNSSDDNKPPHGVGRPSRLLFTSDPVALLLIVTSSASLIIAIACFTYFAKNASHFGGFGARAFFALSRHKIRRGNAKDGVVGLSTKVYLVGVDYV